MLRDAALEPGPRRASAPLRPADSLRERWPASVAFLVLLASIETIHIWSTADSYGTVEFARAHAGWLAIELATMGVGAVAGPILADTVDWKGWRQLALTAAVTFATVGVGAGVIQWAFAAAATAAAAHGGYASGEALVLRGWWYFAMAGLLFGVFAGSRDRNRVAAGAAHAAEIEGGELQRAALELRLRALQARLDPQLLFALLDEIGQQYHRDQPSADRLLDDLIAYLRAVLPRITGGGTTLADEAARVAAYLRILPEARARGLAGATGISVAVETYPFPPAVLLPLVRDAAAGGATRVVLSADAHAVATGMGMVEISLLAVGVARIPGWTDQRFDAVRRTLESYLGASVALEVRAIPEGVAAVLLCPMRHARGQEPAVGAAG